MERKESIGKEATSKKTVEDLEENEELNDESDDGSLPSPDGAFDDADEVHDTNPM